MADERDDELKDEATPEEELPDEALEEAAEEEPRLGELVRDEMQAGARDELKREFAETEAGQKIQAAKAAAKAKLRGKGASEAAVKEAAEEAGKTAVKAAATEATEVAAARTAGSWIARGVLGRILGAVVGSALLSEFPIIGTIVGFILGWILSDLIIRLLTSKTVQNCLLGALVMNALAAVLVLAVLWGIYASLNRGDKGKTLTEPASVTSAEDVANAELVKCLSETKDGETLSLECRHALEADLERQHAQAELARNFLATYEEEADTTEAEAALEEYESALTAVEAAGTNAKNLREQWPKLAEAKDKLAAATATLGLGQGPEIAQQAIKLIGQPSVCERPNQARVDPGQACASFTGSIIESVTGIAISNRAPENWASADGTRFIDLEEIQPGDEVYWTNDTPGKGIAAFDGDPTAFYKEGDQVPLHVGIYIGAYSGDDGVGGTITVDQAVVNNYGTPEKIAVSGLNDHPSYTQVLGFKRWWK